MNSTFGMGTQACLALETDKDPETHNNNKAPNSRSSGTEPTCVFSVTIQGVMMNTLKLCSTPVWS